MVLCTERTTGYIVQHRQDQNNRESYLSNGWRNAEQPLHEQQWVQTEMALVDFQHYTGPPFLHTHPQIVPIPPHLFELWETEGQRLSRQQLPLSLRYAMTIHKSQGQTLSRVVIDLGKAERAVGCSFVALSRVRSLQFSSHCPFKDSR